MYRLKKSLGQHFLHNEAVCAQIVGLLENYEIKNLLEIGPGAGALTKYLLKIPNINFKAIEIDTEKFHYLLKIFPAIEGKIINEDFLHAELPFGDEPFFIIGNFPYNISTEILFKVIDWRMHVQGVVGMFQKEVGMRIASPPGSKVYGVTSVLTQTYFKVNYAFDVLPESFTPPPKVMSGIITLEPHNLALLSEDARRRFISLVKAAFQQRRKTLRNSAKALYNADQLKNEIFNLRPEQLSVQQFIDLACLPV
jgi:16S rRNA (adenine1518-N6/adenine1519-N6)-dimethyltransferase